LTGAEKAAKDLMKWALYEHKNIFKYQEAVKQYLLTRQNYIFGDYMAAAFPPELWIADILKLILISRRAPSLSRQQGRRISKGFSSVRISGLSLSIAGSS
jgi:hypothetical protein